jgi:4-aminobutyrate aminotransferase-like enzyme/Ser/Thr protein kinase RdoA (MazF antagonist)
VTLGPFVEALADPLLAPPPAFGVREATGIAERVFGVSGTLSALASERDQNFRVEDAAGRSFLLKISNPADDAPVVQMQTEALLHVALQDPELPVMRVLRTRDGAHWAEVPGPGGRIHLVRLFTFLDGRNPQATELDQEAVHAWGSVVARLGRALRGFFHPAAGYEILWDLKRAPGLRPLLAHVRHPQRRDAVERVLDRFDDRVRSVLPALRAQVIHNDMSLDNVLVDEAGRITGIVDFGDMTHTALVCDLAVALADVLDGRRDALDVAAAMIAGFVSVTPLEDEEASILGDLVATRAAAAIVISAWRLELYPENREYVSSFDEGAWRFLRLLEDAGLDAVGRSFHEVCRPAAPPYRPMPTVELSRRRERILPSSVSPISYARPVHLVRGEGVWMFDPDGRRYLDAYNNVPAVGHCHPGVAEAVASQARRLNTNTRYLHEALVELGERLVATMPEGLDSVLFVNSGSEANDVAWRIATIATGRAGAIVSEYAYHGVTAATADLSPEEWPAGERPGHVELVPAPDGYRGRYRSEEPGWAERFAEHVEGAAGALADRGAPLAAMFVDAAFTSDGILCPPPRYLQEAARAVREAGGFLVADEVQAGHGRCGDGVWGFETAGIRPEMVTMGKPMGNGHPVAAVVTRSEILERVAARTRLFSTFGGNPVACVAALAVLDAIEREGLQRNAQDVGAHLREGLVRLMDRHPLIGDVRGRGLMVGVELVRDRETREPAGAETGALVDAMRDRGVLVGAAGPAGNVVKIRPPLVFSREHADLLLATFDRIMGDETPSRGRVIVRSEDLSAP